jgi:hypothetical protein
MKKRLYHRIFPILTLISIIGPPFFCIILGISSYLHPEYRSLKDSISRLSFDPFGWLQTLNFIVFGFFIISFGIALLIGMPSQKYLRVVSSLFLLIGIGELISGLFQADFPPTSSISSHALIHQIGASISAAAFPFGLFIFANLMRQDPYWLDMIIFTRVTAVVFLILIVTREVLIPTHWIDSWFGLFERVIVIISLVWFETASIRLWKIYKANICL